MCFGLILFPFFPEWLKVDLELSQAPNFNGSAFHDYCKNRYDVWARNTSEKERKEEARRLGKKVFAKMEEGALKKLILAGYIEEFALQESLKRGEGGTVEWWNRKTLVQCLKRRWLETLPLQCYTQFREAIEEDY